MKEFFVNIVNEFKKFNTYQKIAAVVLTLSVPLCLGMGVNAMSANSSEEESKAPPSSVGQSSVVSSVPQSSSQQSSSKKDIEIFLIPASIEENLEVQIVDKDGQLVLGPTFKLHVKCASNGYSKKWTVSGDGFLELPTIPSGTYTVTIEETEGYIVPKEPVTVKVEKKVEYEKLDVSDKVVDESQIDASKEDAAYDDANNAAPNPPPVLTDTVKYVESSSKVVKKEVEVIKYKYKAVTTEDGTIKTKDGSSSGLYPVVDKDGYVTGAYKLESTRRSSLPSTPSAVSLTAQNRMYSLMVLTLNTGADILRDTPPAEEPIVEPTVEPSAEPSPPPASPSPEPSPTPSAEPTPSPSERPSPSPASPSPEPSPTPSAEPTPSPSERPSPSPEISPSPEVSPSPSAEPSPSPSERPSPSPERIEVEIFGDDDKPLASLNLMLTAQEFKTKEKQDVTVYYGWQNIGGKRYYFDENGNAVTGSQVIQGVAYYFDKNGVMGNRIGIDVSKYQRDIDWHAVKNSGIEFAIIRVGYRGYGSGALVWDKYFEKNIRNATAAGLKVGVYFFSQAINTKEAVEEASMCLEGVKGYKLDYPIFFDTEYSTPRKTGRADGLTKSQRTKIAKAFCETIQNSGYRAGVYASASWFSYRLEYSEIAPYEIWTAHYGVDAPAMGGKHYDIWQYTGSGTCAGVPGAVDMNIGYTAY